MSIENYEKESDKSDSLTGLFTRKKNVGKLFYIILLITFTKFGEGDLTALD